jgi:hypothetical protein
MNWQPALLECALLWLAICLTICEVSRIYRKQRNRRIIRRRLPAPCERCVVPNTREPF